MIDPLVQRSLSGGYSSGSSDPNALMGSAGAVLPPTSAPASGALTPEMIAAIQAAANAGAGAASGHSTASGIDAAMDSSLSGSNLFTPQEISSVEGQWTGGSTPWGDGAPETQNWDQMMQTAVQQALPGQGQSQQSQSSFGTPQQIAQAQPLPFSSFGDIPQIAPTYTAPAMNANANPMADEGMMNQYERMVQQSLAPTFDAQQQAQNESMAGRGIYNSTAAQDAQTQLQGTQSATLAGAYAPIVQQGMTGQQAAASQNATASNSANAFNATAANQATAGNAATQLGIEQGDQSNYNAFEAALLGQGAQEGGNVFQQYLSSMNPQAVTAGATSTLGQGATNATNAGSAAGSAVNPNGLSSAISNVFGGLGRRSTGGGSPASVGGDQSALDGVM